MVFVGPYEHHSNELMWRQTLCDIVEIPLAEDSGLDLVALEETISDPKYAKRQKIGSFSATSNVSGLATDVYAVARILHKHNAIACFDFAACAPYIAIDMNKDAESYFDAIYLSPHKFLGGPGTSGVLIFNEDIYPSSLPPTIAAGGTVDYVSPEKEDFNKDIETREKPGTPGILQAIRIALAFQVKDKVGTAVIDEIERNHYERFMQAFAGDKRISFYGPIEAERKLPIIPFNIKHDDKYLHPKLVTRLMNDLFGIQTRAGCSCAGPYGHYLMNIEPKLSDYYRCIITNVGYTGIKPGWVRLNLHYVLDEDEVDYLVQALKFICEHGYKFISCYVFNLKTGEWVHESGDLPVVINLDIDKVFSADCFQHSQPVNASLLYKQAIAQAYQIAEKMPESCALHSFEPELAKLMYFYAHKVIGVR
jgi:selenocysteine lyase/cysteine desulfurase